MQPCSGCQAPLRGVAAAAVVMMPTLVVSAHSVMWSRGGLRDFYSGASAFAKNDSRPKTCSNFWQASILVDEKKHMFFPSSGVFCVDSEHSQLDLSEQHLRVGVLNQPGA